MASIQGMGKVSISLDFLKDVGELVKKLDEHERSSNNFVVRLYRKKGVLILLSHDNKKMSEAMHVVQSHYKGEN